MKRCLHRTIVIFFVILVASGNSFGQFDLSKYFNDNTFSLLDLTDHQDVKFTWSIEGKLQVQMNEGINEYLEGNLFRAVANLDEVIKTDSSFWPAFYYRGLCKKNSGNYKGAEIDFQKAIKLNSRIPESYLELGEIHHARNKFALARKAYESAQDLAPNSVQPLYLLGTLALSRGETGKAVRNYEKCNELDPTFAPALVTRGVLKYRADKKDVTKNLEYFDKAIAADSTYKPAYFWRGVILVSGKQNEKALIDWGNLLRLMPNNVMALQIRGFLLVEMNRFDDAFVDLRKALSSIEVDEEKYMSGETILNKRIDLKNTGLYLIRKGYGLKEETFSLLKKAYCLMLANNNKGALTALQSSEDIEKNAATNFLKALVFEDLKQYDSALSNYNKALALDNDIYDAHRKRAIYRLEDKNIKGVYQDFIEMKRIEPESNATYRLSGIIKSEVRDFYGCIVDLARYIKSDTTDVQALKVRAYCRSEVKDYKGSNEDYQRAIDMNKYDLKSYALIYRNHLLNLDTLSAINTLKSMLKLSPNDADVSLGIAELFIRRHQYDSAGAIIYKVIKKIAPGFTPVYMSTALFLQGQTLVGQSYLEKGIDKIDQSIKLDPSNPVKLFYRARLNLKMERTKDAVKDLRKLQELNYAPANEYYEKYLK